jgi:predicted nucleotidyltransferase
VTGIEPVFRQAAADLDALNRRWAVIGGFAVAARALPRFTQDVDFAVSVASDNEAEAIVHRLQIRGYAVGMLVEQDEVGRLATVRLIRPVAGSSQTIVDLLFASSGIEDQIVERADRIEIWPGCVVPVATAGDLIALKLLSRDDRRLQDQLDLQALLSVATKDDLNIVWQAVTDSGEWASSDAGIILTRGCIDLSDEDRPRGNPLMRTWICGLITCT